MTRLTDIHPEADKLQDDLNNLIERYTTDYNSLLFVASLLFASSVRCYEVTIGKQGVVEFLNESAKKAAMLYQLDKQVDYSVH
jgi:hypothetical protein